MSSKYLTVSQLTQYIKQKFDRDPYLKKVFVKGEISNYNPKRRYKNQYFSLKDDQTVISAIIFSSRGKNIRFDIEEGMSVLVSGWVSVYEKNGSYQLYIDDIQPDGIGALYLAYEQLKEKLEKEGLFRAEHKQEIPKYPKRIGVITSHSGAVIEDIRSTVKRRFPLAQVVLFPTLVQGDKAATDIVNSIEQLEDCGDIDTAIIGRGGGSFEDLFSFNDEQVVRAIYAMKTPVISSVGHETDTTLADLVADLRAPTPTAAAEQATPVLSDLLLRLSQLQQRLFYFIDQQIKGHKRQLVRLEQSSIFQRPERLYVPYAHRLDTAENQLFHALSNQAKHKKYIFELVNQRFWSQDLTRFISNYNQLLDQLTNRLIHSARHIYADNKQQFIYAIQALELLSPLKVISRGYAIIYHEEKPVYSVGSIHSDDSIQIQLKDGLVHSHVEKIDKGKIITEDIE